MELLRFDRHRNMDGKTRREILNLLTEIELIGYGDFELENSLFGLFDGYYYEDILKKYADKITKTNPKIGNILTGIIEKINGYLISDYEEKMLINN